ncbi:Pimeloyl-ACP methyl ester carboxylesterase [Pseudomonas syringae pv. actinidiae]|uniref:Pimeloyl-ACP methyl ester carboxylesterase n=1 Tax=Pseudomonas syringae pv. actinidiae TaxID=103796 RepID=A0A2V0QAE9_PSESF|nr:Pimeloyl-ACP methyl ester carboxylesterase [Pseudomonas syringae pv. actinidiae]
MQNAYTLDHIFDEGLHHKTELSDKSGYLFFLFFLFEIFPETHLGWRRITQNTVWCYGLCIPPR